MATYASTGELSTPTPFEGAERFAAYVAHELRTPLATQRAILELALADPDADVTTWREIAEGVLRQCRQQERLLEACLTLARTRDRTQRCESIDLAVITADVLRAHNPGELEHVVTLEPAWTSGDPSLVERLVANLVSNAIRHNVTGGRIEVATRFEFGRAVLSIANTGRVVPAVELQRLFLPFQRLNSSPRASSDGVGLGLTIVRAIADAHHARVTARGRGAPGGLEIDVSFPADRARNGLTGAGSSGDAVAATGDGLDGWRIAELAPQTNMEAVTGV